jgi:hypothetical protein
MYFGFGLLQEEQLLCLKRKGEVVCSCKRAQLLPPQLHRLQRGGGGSIY